MLVNKKAREEKEAEEKARAPQLASSQSVVVVESIGSEAPEHPSKKQKTNDGTTAASPTENGDTEPVFCVPIWKRLRRFRR